MGTRPVVLTARVTDAAGHTATASTVLAVGQPALLGWSPPNSTAGDLSAMLARFPSPPLVRLYSPAGAGLASWSGSLLTCAPRDATLVYSFKDRPATLDVAGWLSARPAAWTAPIYLCWAHEPEQGPSAGDPTPVEFQQGWRDLAAALAGHRRRREVRLLPVFTEYAARRSSTWWADFGQVAALPGVDAVGFDIYDTGYPAYRSPVERNDFALSTARRVGKSLVVAEWGIARKASDPDGTQCARAMRDNMTYLRRQPDVDAVSWFYRGDCNLDARTPERQAFVDLMG
ncbi:glycosyl hydrolase [Micromonospora carbonacea]|uniref:Glycosyl hydrolase catalytic core n=1 Tax=Micromonospora carbonacea TaxID=47853 RepID=A0A1C5A2Y1_9ACTN|nr:glycosyl hydrolase [Micromonospora carbonacea]SCF39451.1 Glycosyl hydrolase catalytic core [Micromonospora carbonacea]